DRQRYVNDQASYYRTDPDVETDDGRQVIWLNPKGSKGPVTPKLKAFLDHVNGIEVEDELCDNIDRAVLEMKRSYVIRREYMFFTDYVDNERRIAKEEGINIGRNEGLTTGRNEIRISLVLQHHRKGTSVETIAEILFMSEEEVRKIIRDNAVLH
ncbi:MAG: hypothetical protein K6G61_06160, partial [Solobacterium sp.]|nr:hypothetical protein [Solobacterium sp.]